MRANEFIVENSQSFNDDDWYEIDPTSSTVVNSYGPQAFKQSLFDKEVRLKNGNVLVKGLRAKHMNLNPRTRN